MSTALAGDLIQNNGTQTRLNPYFGGIAYAFTNTNSAGNYGTLMATRTYSHGLALQAIYTYGKSLDTMSNAQTLTEGAFTGGRRQRHRDAELPIPARTLRLRHSPAVPGRRHLGCSAQLFQRRGQEHSRRMAIRRQVYRADRYSFHRLHRRSLHSSLQRQCAPVKGGCPEGSTIMATLSTAGISMPTARITICPWPHLLAGI